MTRSFSRRNLIITASTLFICGLACAQTSAWPKKPIKLVVGYPAGLTVDVTARIYAEKLSKTLGQPIIVENRTGATGNIAQDYVAKSPADGHTLLYAVSNSFVSNPYIYSKLPFDVDKDFAPVGVTATSGLYFIVNKDFPAKTLPEALKLLRENPGKYSYGSYGVGGFPHLVMEVVQDAEKLNMLHVPYKGGALQDVVGGSIPLVLEPPGSAIPMIRDGRIRALAYVGSKRHPATPDVPLLSDTVPAMKEITGFFGIWAPAGTPKEVLSKLNREIVKASRDADVQEKIRSAFAEPASSTPAEMASMVKTEQARWRALIRAKNIRLD
jgi:tripartite-type tricarboxylate transporter receptor subunit TctC